MSYNIKKENTERLSRALEFKRKGKYIYLLKCEKFFKIGYADNLKSRLNLYRVHNPYEVILICSFLTEKFINFENWIYENYTNRLHRGEWFNFSKKELKTIKSKWFIK
jgi:hypothetical protein